MNEQWLEKKNILIKNILTILTVFLEWRMFSLYKEKIFFLLLKPFYKVCVCKLLMVWILRVLG